MGKLEKMIVNTVTIGGGGISSICLLAMVFLISADVICRVAFNNPLPGAYDIVEYGMVFFTYFAIAYCELRGDHVNIDMIFDRFSKKTQNILNITSRIIMFFLAVIMAQQAWVRTIDSFRVGRTAVGPVKIPHGPSEGAVFIGCLLLCVIFLLKIYRSALELRDSKSKISSALTP